MSPLLHLWEYTTSESLGDDCFQLSLDIPGELRISSCSISSPSAADVSGTTYHRISNCSFTSFDGGFLDSDSSQPVGRYSSSVSYHKRSCLGYFNRMGAQESAFAALTLLLLRGTCCVDKVSLLQYVRQQQGQLEHVQQRFTSNIGNNAQVGMLKIVYQTIPFLPLN